jgi:hypothetical protein
MQIRWRNQAPMGGLDAGLCQAREGGSRIVVGPQGKEQALA